MHFDPSPMASRISPTASWPHLVDANAYASPLFMPTGTGTITATANRLYIFPFFLPIPVALTALGSVVVTGVNSSTGRMAIFNWDQENKEVRSLVADMGAAVDTEIADQGLVAYTTAATGLPLVLEPGWYAFGAVFSGAVEFRYVKGVDSLIQGNFDVSTTDLAAVNYYYADGAGMIAGGITDPGAYAELTEVTSTSDFTAFQAMLCRFNLNPKVPA